MMERKLWQSRVTLQPVLSINYILMESKRFQVKEIHSVSFGIIMHHNGS